MVQLRVQAVRGEQLCVSAALDDHALVDDENDVGALYGGQPVRDGDRGASLEQAAEALKRSFVNPRCASSVPWDDVTIRSAPRRQRGQRR